MAVPSVDPILTRAELAIKTYIESIRQLNGYYFNWGTVNQLDLAKAVFPCALVYLDPEETNKDEEGGVSTDSYINEAAFRIIIVGTLPSETSNPLFDNNAMLTKGLHDLKKIFGINYSLGGLVDLMQYKSSARVYRTNNDIIIPSKLDTRWMVTYTQQRTEPTVLDP